MNDQQLNELHEVAKDYFLTDAVQIFPTGNISFTANRKEPIVDSRLEHVVDYKLMNGTTQRMYRLK